MADSGAISLDECWRLLGLAGVGRVALSVDALPVVLPVRYVVDGPEVAMCLGEGPVPSRAAHEAIVALAVDELDPRSHVGWYVHAVGMARMVPGPDRPPDGTGDDAGLVVARMTPTIVRGRRVRLQAPPPAGG